MTLFAFGLNHNTAPLEIRERVSFAPGEMAATLQTVRDSLALQEVAILSTCNRTEIYHSSEVSTEQMALWLAERHQVSHEMLAPCAYGYQNQAAVRHMMQVAAGLDSMILGEPQILGQMKSAYAVAQAAGTLGSDLHAVFQQVFTIAKRVRTETAIGENPVSVAFAAVALAQQIFSNLKEDTALLIGAGETIELVARHLREQGIKRLLVANRTLNRAQQWAGDLGAEPILLSDIPEYLHQADIVISSTASQLPLLGKGAVESALKQRKHRPMFMVDLAVPRDIEAEVGELDDVYLYTVDDLREVIDEGRRSREEAAQAAHLIVDEGVNIFTRELRALEAVDTLRSFREHANNLSEAELAKALKNLAKGVAAEEVLAQLSRGLTNKFIHTPTTKMKEATASGRTELLDAVQELFELGERGDDK